MQRELIDKIKEAVPRCSIHSIKCKVVPEIESEDDAAPSQPPADALRPSPRPLEMKISPTIKEALDGVEDEQLRESIRRLVIYNKSFS